MAQREAPCRSKYRRTASAMPHRRRFRTPCARRETLQEYLARGGGIERVASPWEMAGDREAPASPWAWVDPEWERMEVRG